MNSIELFAGAGGLALGMAHAGYQHSAIIEWDDDACQTIQANRHHYITRNDDFLLFQGDARHFDFGHYAHRIDVISGGPPCQPFSMGGKAVGCLDQRDMFSVAIDSVRQIMPKAFIFENVKGLLRKSFSSYLEYIILQLTFPNIRQKTHESWTEHGSRLERMHTAGKVPPSYHVVFRLFNAADYGVPQKRHRVFIVGFRHDMGVKWSPPEATHSEHSLLVSQWITGEYWERHHIARRHRPDPPLPLQGRIARLSIADSDKPSMAPWITVRDAICDLPDPEKNTTGIPHHEFNEGARPYPGHTGSPLDEPAKTLKAGDHGVPGGENMLIRSDGSVRYFTVREAARIQTFPDHYTFRGAWTETMRQLGNAVPVKLAEVVARSVASSLR